MIVKNEEAVLARCLESIKDAVDEIIIVDTGSTDKTKEIALGYTTNVYDFEWIEDFSAARNFSFKKATMDYQMWLDADDVVPPHSLEKILQLKKDLDPAIDMVTMRYITHYDADGKPILISTRERLLKTSQKYKWMDAVHECIPLVNNLFQSDIEISHQKLLVEGNSTRNLKIYQALEEKGEGLTPRQQYYYARELSDHLQWAKAAEYFEKFLDDGKGWIEDNIASCFNLGLCYKNLNEEDKILSALIRSFQYDSPRAEICSELGYYYKNKMDFRRALKWFLVAAFLGDPNSFGFVLIDYWGYIPNIEACVCYSNLGDYENALIFNERAAAYRSDKEAI
jgi:glycosyltransferase involved in cell wall biosynthesis